ncbi:TonB-dependent receptor plug domain-containing protein [Longimicrobium terrae]|uniref:TonB-dependent receptor plug domain-containing protein n=1 Tax=Longimicrobium terrae TaxID=1639882 RepID=A0A841H5E5_9BACT|nr:TonB-dependent receptor plug domain-containing protein [Longimicrobium terrae]MBB4638740.1 hypothetical protein [Longimicrobium terrae]MBB6072979.1 hypothetical protein [Longimicrobium terrae]
MTPRLFRRGIPALLCAFAAVLVAAAELRAQVPAARDTVRKDSALVADPNVRADTLPDRPAADSVPADSTLPAPVFPLLPEPRETGFGPGVWVFGPVELARFHGLSMLDLLDRIPGIVVTREGSPGRPAGVAAFGGGGGRLRVFLDGWEMPGLNASSPELQRIPLVDVSAVRVFRGLGEIRVDIQTLRLTDRRPYAQIEGGEGDYATRILRGLFSRPLGQRMVATVGVDVVETGGFRRAEPFSANTGFGRLSYAFSADRALELEYRSTAVDAERSFAFNGTRATLPTEAYDRGELMLRARGRVLGDVWVDGAVGRSWQRPGGGDTITLEREAVQAYARAVADIPLGRLEGALRYRGVDDEGFAAGGAEASLRAELTPGRAISAWGEVRAGSWGGSTGVELEAAARTGAWRGVSLFGQAATGTRAIRYWRDTSEVVQNLGNVINPSIPALDTVPIVDFPDIFPTLAAVRAGAEWTRGAVQAGAAFVVHDLGGTVPYGFYFDRGTQPAAGTTVSGVEAYASVPLFWRQLRFDAHYTDFFAVPDRPYTPARFGRAALEFHGVYKDGNLEPTLRAELLGRDRAVSLDATTGALTALTEPYLIANLFVQIRVLDVRAFYRAENLLNRRTAADIPGLTLPGARSLFGVRWFFRD